MTLKIIDVRGQRVALGRKPPTEEQRRKILRFDDYATPALPLAPMTTSYWGKAASALSQMYLNDSLGDCVIACMEHADGVFSGNVTGTPEIYDRANTLRLYEAIGGYVPGDPSTDQGCNEVTALQYWQKSGLTTTGRRIAGWCGVDATNRQRTAAASWLMGNLVFGVSLPDAWVSDTSLPTWDVAGPPNPDNGHCFLGVDLEGDDGVAICTWGMRKTITWDAIAKYAVPSAEGGELYAVLAYDWEDRVTGLSPSGFDASQLRQDLQSQDI